MWEAGSSLGRGSVAALESPSIFQQRIDYVARTDGQPVYMGFGLPGAATSDKTWLIQKFTYTTINSNDYMTLRQSVVGDWDSRATLTYR